MTQGPTIQKLTPADIAASKIRQHCIKAAWRGFKRPTTKSRLMHFSSHMALAAFLLGTEWREKFLG